MPIPDLTDHDWLQIEMAAYGCIDSQLKNWPDLTAALGRVDSLAADISMFDRSFVMGFCRGLMDVKNAGQREKTDIDDAARILEDHDMLEEAERLRSRAQKPGSGK